MIDVKEARGIISGSFIVFLLSLIDKEYQNRGSIINLRQYILKQTRKVQRYNLVLLSNDAWKSVLDKFKDDHIAFSVVVVVETLAFNYENELKKVFGNNIINLCVRFAAKQGEIDIDKKVIEDSYMIADELKKITDKLIFDYNKKIKVAA